MTDGNLTTNDTTEPAELTYEDWATALRDGTLLGQRCSDCGHVTAAPKAACAHCGSQGLTTTELPTTGEVYTETTLEVVPEGSTARTRSHSLYSTTRESWPTFRRESTSASVSN